MCIRDRPTLVRNSGKVFKLYEFMCVGTDKCDNCECVCVCVCMVEREEEGEPSVAVRKRILRLCINFITSY